jgi:hypothetical protein
LLQRVFGHLTERLVARLRARHLVARRLTVKIAYTDYTTAQRSVPIGLAALDIELWDAARRAFALARQRTVALRAIGVTVDRFPSGPAAGYGDGGGRAKGRGGAACMVPPMRPLRAIVVRTRWGARAITTS